MKNEKKNICARIFGAQINSGFKKDERRVTLLAASDPLHKNLI